MINKGQVFYLKSKNPRTSIVCDRNYNIWKANLQSEGNAKTEKQKKQQQH